MKNIFSLIVLLSAAFVAWAQPNPDTLWTARIGGSAIDYCHAIVQSDDGGYLLAGETVSYGDHASDAYMVKLNSNGVQQWYRTYGWLTPVTTNAFVAVQQTDDYGYILVGKTCVTYVNYMYAVRTYANGDTAWTRMYYDRFSSADLWAKAVMQTADDGFLIAGYEASASPTSFVCLVRLAANGDTLWTNFMRSRQTIVLETCEAMARSPEGGYVLVGRQSVGTNSANALLMKISEVGGVEWVHAYGYESDDVFHSITATADGGYIMAGESYVDASQAYDIYVVRVTAAGDTVWTRRIGGTGSDKATSVHEVTGGFVIGAETASYGAGNHDFYLTKLSVNGDPMWSRTYGGSDYEICDAMQKTGDGGFVLAGATQSFGAQSFDVYVVKTGPDQPGGTCPLLCQDAIPISVGETINQCSFHGSGEHHWFTIQLTAGLYRFELNGFSSPSDYDLYTYLNCSDPNPTGCGGNLVGPEDFSCQVTGTLNVLVEVDAYSGPYGSYWLRISRTEAADPTDAGVPAKFDLFNYPNPFNPTTTIRYDVKTTGFVSLKVFDVLGREVATLVNGTVAAGSYSTVWNAGELPSGVYLCRMDATNFTQTKKLMMLK
jgi:hypothetical protein